ncbi:hypothetical protein TWF718_010634 [Orbilia javanica]|uniref:T6SS Phospholipase effector Tle1-like catalytic domain-containing protein n=1 Tax=Orbilia javanica TaxID=47235 RepID=A0AAN8MS93_9PEZI
MSVRRIVSLFNHVGQEYLDGGTNDMADINQGAERELPNGTGPQEAVGSPAGGTGEPSVKTVWRFPFDNPQSHETDRSNTNNTDDTNPMMRNWTLAESDPCLATGTWTPAESQPLPARADSGTKLQANGSGVYLNGDFGYTNGNGVHSEDNITPYTKDNSIKVISNDIMHTNVNGNPPSEQKEESIYTRPSGLPRPITNSASSTQRRRAYTFPSAPSIMNPRPQRPPGVNDPPNFTRPEAASPDIVSKIPRLAGIVRNTAPDSTLAAILRVPSVSTLPSYSPPSNLAQGSWNYHESKATAPEEPQEHANDYSEMLRSDITGIPERVSRASPEEPSQLDTKRNTSDTVTWADADRSKLHTRESITHNLPKINTNFPEEDSEAPTPVFVGNIHSTSAADRIKDLELEIGDLRQRLKKALEKLETKAAASNLSPTADVDRLHEYLKPELEKVEETRDTKVSPIVISPVIRAKKLIMILDATNSSTVRPMSTGKLYHGTQPPRTVLKRLSDCLTTEHKDTRRRQQVFYLSGCGTGEDNWQIGDELLLFGFSRGAFAIRAITALITEIGLLNKAGMAHFETLYDTYFDPKYGKCRSTDEYEKWRGRCTGLAQDLSQMDGVTITKVPVKFLGCLETIGWSNYEDKPLDGRQDAKKLWERGAFDFRHLLIHENVENAFHALALDEDRATHPPLLMFRPIESIKPLTQVWFTGSHVNIGGGQLTAEVGKNLASLAPDQNELSDIVFLFLITECHEFLGFSKKYVNKAVSVYLNNQSTADVVKDVHFKYHWISSKIDGVGPDSGQANVFGRIRHATSSKKRHIRTPLRYRPHWFDWEPWSRYKSCEAIHISSQYRTKHYPEYVPKALLDYRCTKTFERFGARRNASEGVPGETSVLRYNAPKLKEEKFYYAGKGSDKRGLYPKNMSLPIIKLSAFEVLLAGGETLIFGFGIAFKDIYRESPPVFQYRLDELTLRQEDWILRVEVQPSRKTLTPISMTDRTIALRNVQSVPTSLKYQHCVIKQDSPYSSIKARPGASKAEGPRPQWPPYPPYPPPPPPPPSQQIRLNAAQSSPNLRNSVSEAYASFSFTNTPQIEDESGSGKGKGLHSSHLVYGKDGDRVIGMSQGPKGYDGTDERDPDQEEVLEPTNTSEGPKEPKKKMGTIRKFLSFASLRGKKKDAETSNINTKKPAVGQIDGGTDGNADSFISTDGPSDIEPGELEAFKREQEEREHKEWLATFDRSSLVLPKIEEPGWMKQLKKPGEIQPCKFKHHHGHSHSGHGGNRQQDRGHDHDHGFDDDTEDDCDQDHAGDHRLHRCNAHADQDFFKE